MSNIILLNVSQNYDNPIFEKVLECNKLNISSILGQDSCLELKNQSRTKLIQNLSKISQAYRSSTTKIIIFIQGHGYEHNGDLRYCTKSGTMSLYEMVNLFHKLEIFIIWDVCRVSIPSTTYEKSLSSETVALVLTSCSSAEVSYGNVKLGGYLTEIITKTMKLGLQHDSQKTITMDILLQWISVAIQCYKLDRSGHPKFYQLNLNTNNHQKIINQIKDLTK